jgi:hypothetical protein
MKRLFSISLLFGPIGTVASRASLGCHGRYGAQQHPIPIGFDRGDTAEHRERYSRGAGQESCVRHPDRFADWS